MPIAGFPNPQAATGLTPVPLAGGTLYSEQPALPLTCADHQTLVDAFDANLALLMRYLNRPTTHVFVPLGAPEEGYHVAFQGPFGFEDLKPFFRRPPNAITLVDGRPYGFLRFRLSHLDGDVLERVAEIEVSLAHDAPSVGFELVWAPSEFEPLRVIRFVQRKGEDAVQQVARLVSEWGNKFRLIKAYPELQRQLTLR